MLSARTLFISSALFVSAVGISSLTLDPGALARTEAAAGPAVVEAARAFLASLDEAKREKASFDFGEEVRFRWHFIPETQPPREGITLKELDRAQREKVQALLAASLSEIGHERAEQVRELEAILAEIEGERRRFPRDPDLYYVSVFGKPSSDGSWGFRFEGHHLSLNFTLDGDRLISATPLFYGANPAVVPEGPKKGLRVLGEMEDIARELVTSLDDEQRRVALGERTEDVKGTMSARYEDTLPEGVRAAGMSEAQKKTLRKLIAEYTRNLDEGRREALERDVEAGFDKIYFAWRGGTKRFEKHSYVVHGPTFIISYANEQNGARHIHAGLRDRGRDFGLEGEEG